MLPHWRYMMVDGTDFWVSLKWLKLLRKAGHLQLIQNSAPSNIVWRQCDIQIGLELNCRQFDGKKLDYLEFQLLDLARLNSIFGTAKKVLLHVCTSIMYFENVIWKVHTYQYNSILKCPQLKVSKSRKQILKFSFEPKNEQKYFCISALASKSGRITKI